MSACVVAHTLGMLSFVPGGAGVFEATMFALLAEDPAGPGRPALAAALITYRLVYYLLPLSVAIVVALVAGVVGGCRRSGTTVHPAGRGKAIRRRRRRLADRQRECL